MKGRVSRSGNQLLAACFVALMISAGFLLYEYRSGNQLNARFAAAKREHEARAAGVREAEKTAVAAELKAAGLKKAVEKLEKPEAPAPRPLSYEEQLAAGRAFLAAYPQAEGLVAAMSRVVMESSLSRVRLMGLSREQMDKVMAIMNRLPRGGNGMFSGMVIPAPLPADPLSSAEANRQLQEVMGDSGYAQYLDMQKTATERDLVSDVVVALTDSDSPLGADQAQALLKIVIKNTSDEVNGAYRRRSTDWNEVEKEAANVLSASQLSAVAAIKAKSLAEAALSRDFMRTHTQKP